MKGRNFLLAIIGAGSFCFLFLLYKEHRATAISSPNTVTSNNRFLRRRKYYWKRNRNRSYYKTKPASPASVIWGILIVFLVVAGICVGPSCCGGLVYCCFVVLGTASIKAAYFKRKFEDYVTSVEQEVDSLRKNSDQAPNHTATAVPIVKPFSGEYDASYIERGETRSVNIELIFTPIHGNGKTERGYFRISGNGKDPYAETKIEKGIANMDGTAWWVEETVSGKIGIKVISRGKFDFTKHTFKGTWYSDTAKKGRYSYFQRKTSTLDGNKMSTLTNAPTIIEGTGAYEGTPLVVGTIVENQYTTTPYKTDL